ncbi:hypothetical protein DM02DRAFT_619514 [Periconia macrospinosa]|uniref:Uncharacterized protein n=1 Tax=Periconia macrospinosa TaxID=97972 RepID=A0A2V1D4Y3_9PLEO|nr:hypothetical protein DM02DRAFT_619514 [Periconia macrospinosa]
MQNKLAKLLEIPLTLFAVPPVASEKLCTRLGEQKTSATQAKARHSIDEQFPTGEGGKCLITYIVQQKKRIPRFLA